MSTYETNVDAVLDELVTKLKDITQFGNRVYKHNFDKLSAYPSAVVNLLLDRVEPAAAYQFHNLSIMITIFEGTAASKSADDLIAITGLVADKLDTIKTNPPKWATCLVEGNITYGFIERQKTAFFISLVPITVKSKW